MGIRRSRSAEGLGSPLRMVLTAAAVSTAWGAVSLWMHESWPSPWDVGGNSVATWVVVPFLLGRRATHLRLAALGGLTSLVLLVAAYYVTLLLATGRGDFASTILYWTLAAFLVGGPLGVLGFWSASRSTWGRALCALPGAAFVAEALPVSARFLFLADDDGWAQALWVVLGIGITLVVARGSCRGLVISMCGLVVLTAGALVASDVAIDAFVQLTSALE